MRRRGPGLARTAARTAVVAGTATAVVGGVSSRQHQRAVQSQQMAEYEAAQQQAALEQAAAQAVASQQAAAPQAAAPPPAQTDTIAQLEKLAQMHHQGVITAEEFSVMKAKLLGL